MGSTGTREEKDDEEEDNEYCFENSLTDISIFFNVILNNPSLLNILFNEPYEEEEEEEEDADDDDD
eukprot:CAMPEP_0114345990 /NCGR_PEP_ID=MMETSP0101-20121206/12712_1 /TAXON_ID=38822 ORGANISM="Pteridomonas danica, Strain PT" /NCGR_SAMPLE_ID=MMETSP0101 /ASSEMBLY_ACC=CAM_ASM_000211 /LENGTH=65 /DNA_ID=CAMNT_0001482371 /DNA_START=381 /DNA_END=578 /DNA_ORIENTATION=+